MVAIHKEMQGCRNRVGRITRTRHGGVMEKWFMIWEHLFYQTPDVLRYLGAVFVFVLFPLAGLVSVIIMAILIKRLATKR